jgi:ribose 5-phosphate isomerase B
MIRIFLGSDHAGYPLKILIKDYLASQKKYEVIDVGTEQKVSCHYPIFANRMAKAMKPEDRGILVCGSGIGIGIAANKCGLPCATAYDEYTASECGKYFHAMALGGRVVSTDLAFLMVEEFLKSSLAMKDE